MGQAGASAVALGSAGGGRLRPRAAAATAMKRITPSVIRSTRVASSSAGLGRVERQHVVERVGHVVDLVGQLALAPRLDPDATPRRRSVTVALVRSMISVWRSSATSGSIKSMISYGLILITSCGLGSPGSAGRRAAPRSGGGARPGAGSCSVLGPSILVPVRRLGWFLVGAAGATGALVAAPGLYGRLREAVGAGDVWNDFEPEADRDYAPPRDAEPVYAEAVPEPAAGARAGSRRRACPRARARGGAGDRRRGRARRRGGARAVVPEPAPEPEAEAEAPPEQSGVYETVVWPVPSAQAEEGEAAPAADEADDDTAEIASAPLTPAPPPDDTEATDLRSRIEASRERLHRKAQGGGDDEDEEPAADEPDPGA